jgi:hypothetical protein
MRRFQIDINGIAHPVEAKPLLPPRPLGIFAVALHDFETSAYFRADWNISVPRGLFDDRDRLKNDQGWPEIVPLEPRVGVRLTEELQWFWFKQLVLSYYGHADYEQLTIGEKEFIQKAWGGLTKGHTAFTNGRGTDTCRDFVRDENRKAELPILWENTCGGSLLELNSDATYTKGHKVKTLRTSDYEQWKDWTFRDHPQFFTFATNATPFMVGTRDIVTNTGPWKVDPMHYLDGKHVPVPILSDAGHVFVDPHRVRILSPREATPSPYVQ